MTAAGSAQVRVLVVDDSLPFRTAVRELIGGTTGFTCIGDARSGEEAVEETMRLRPDLVLMDVRMPGIGGIEAASKIASQAPAPVVVLITGAELPERVPDGIAAVMLAKDQLNHASLRRLWTDHLRTPAA